LCEIIVCAGFLIALYLIYACKEKVALCVKPSHPHLANLAHDGRRRLNQIRRDPRDSAAETFWQPLNQTFTLRLVNCRPYLGTYLVVDRLGVCISPVPLLVALLVTAPVLARGRSASSLVVVWPSVRRYLVHVSALHNVGSAHPSDEKKGDVIICQRAFVPSVELSVSKLSTIVEIRD
jgi:hypothetical protein